MNEREYKKIGICNDCGNPIYEGDIVIKNNNSTVIYHNDCFSNSNIHNKVNKKMEFEKNVKELSTKIAETLVNKNKGYGNSFYDGLDIVKNIFKNIDNKLLTDIDYINGLLRKIHYISFYVREMDKLNRFINLIVSDIPEEDKKINIYDAVLDLAGYSILFYNYLKNHDK